MRIFWLNGNLTLEPDRGERGVLVTLYDLMIANGVKIGRELPQTGEGSPREVSEERSSSI